MKWINKFYYLSLCGILSQAGCNSPEEEKPNVVFFLIDDLGWYDLASNGNPVIQTPHIDSLKKLGLCFEQAYASPLCTPTRAALMTGKYPGRLQMTRVGDDYDRGLLEKPSRYHPVMRQKSGDKWDELSVDVRVDLPLEEKTLGEIAKDAGYKTGFIGKWHLGFDEYYPDNQGFDWVFGGDHWSDYFAPYVGHRTEDVEAEPGEYITDRLTEEAIGFIDRNKNDPFLLCLWHYGVHAPIEAKPDLVAYYDQKIGNSSKIHPVYAAMVHSIDESIGRVVQCLKQNGLYENTLIVFMSDNGPLVGTGTNGIYDPRIVLNRHTENDELTLNDSVTELYQEFECNYGDFRLGFSYTVPASDLSGAEKRERQQDQLDEFSHIFKPVLKAEIFRVSGNREMIMQKNFNLKQLTSNPWNYIHIRDTSGSGPYAVRFTLMDSEQEVSLKSTFDSSIPDAELQVNGEVTGEDLYLRCIPKGLNMPWYSSLTSSGPLRGHKIQVYEGGIKVPLFFVWEGSIKRGQSINVPVAHIDLYPTLASFMGQDLPESIDGINLYEAIMQNESIPDRTLYWHYPHYMYSDGAEVIRDGSYKYIEFYKDGRRELYNLTRDPGENNNLINQENEKADTMKSKLYKWLEEIDASMPSPADNHR